MRGFPCCGCTRLLRPGEDGFRFYLQHLAFCPLARSTQIWLPFSSDAGEAEERNTTIRAAPQSPETAPGVPSPDFRTDPSHAIPRSPARP